MFFNPAPNGLRHRPLQGIPVAHAVPTGGSPTSLPAVLARGRVVGSRDDAWTIGNGKRHHLILVFIACPIEPDMRFSLTRSGALRQPSSWSIQDIHCPSFSVTGQIRSSRSMSISWLSSIVCAGVLVICLGVELALRQAPSLTSSLNLVEVETLPSE